jgi:hypothetical protein
MPFVLLALFVGPAAGADEKIEVFRTGDELIVKLERFDLLRQAHAGLNAALKLRADGKDKELRIDLADPAVQGPMVVDLTRFGKCSGIDITVKDGAGQMVAEKTIAPIPEIPVQSTLASPQPGQPASAGQYAYIEPGTDMRKARAGSAADQPPSPRILLPDVRQLRRLKLAPPKPSVSKQEITFPVVADIDLPITTSAVIGRQTSFPDDPAKASIYFCYKKGIYDGQKLTRRQKFLVEVPIQSSWGEGEGDEDVVLAPNQFHVHLTNELGPPSWDGKRSNMLGDGDGDLGQTGDRCADEQGRLYWRAGRYLVRFDPHTRKFEQSPVIDFAKKVPPGAGMINEGLTKITCIRGRVFLTMCYDTWNGKPGGGTNRRVGGVFSIPQDWSDAQAFASDIRLHVGSWENAQPTLYKTPPKPNSDVRKLAGGAPTETGLFITTAEAKYEGGPWRLDLDEKGNNKFFGVVKSIDATVADDGTPLVPTRLLMRKGYPQDQELDPGTTGGRNLIRQAPCGEITIPRSSIRQIVLGREGLKFKPRGGKHSFPVYEGAPQGTLTVRYDLVQKIRSIPEAQGPFAASFSGGPSAGPAFLLTPIPGEPAKALAVCDYTGYTLSIFDFSGLQDKKLVEKHPLATPVGLGPYNSAWLTHGDEQWLYINGYIGMTRIKYAQGGKVVDKMTSVAYHTAPYAVDGHRRGALKHVDGLMPAFGGRLINTGSGAVGRGGSAFSTGLELLDAKLLGQTNAVPSQTAAYMSRCVSLKTLQSRLLWSVHDGSRRQEVFAACGGVQQAFVNELTDRDKALAPANLDAKVFLYEVDEARGLRDLYGFSIPRAKDDQSNESHIVLSPCHRFLVIMKPDGDLYTYGIAQKQFIDGFVLTTSSGSPVNLMGFKRPSAYVFASPDGQIFILTGPADKDAASIHFHRIVVDSRGRLSVEPHLAVACASNADCNDFGGVVRCFLPDRRTKDGSYDLVLGYSQATVQPFVRVITDFIPPTSNKLRQPPVD